MNLKTAGLVQYQGITVIHHTNGLKKKMIISIQKKHPTKFSIPIYLKILNIQRKRTFSVPQ
jgi:hypothetical protein